MYMTYIITFKYTWFCFLKIFKNKKAYTVILIEYEYFLKVTFHDFAGHLKDYVAARILFFAS